jgi:hypothetical protein
MTGWSAAANKPDLSEAEWAVSRRTSVENKRTRLGLLTTATILFKKENKEFRTGAWSRSGRPNGRLSGSETNQSKCRDAMRWTDKPESARLRLHSSQPSQWEASDTDGKAQG